MPHLPPITNRAPAGARVPFARRSTRPVAPQRRRTRCPPLGVVVDRLEVLEGRIVLAAPPPVLVPPVPLLDPKTVPQFVNTLPPALDPSFVYQPDAAGNHYTVAAAPVTQNILGAGLPSTPLFGYGTPGAPSYPGKTFVVQKNQGCSLAGNIGPPPSHGNTNVGGL